MEAVIIVIHLIVVTALIAVVLLQRSEGGALGIGGGGGGFMTSRGTANILTRATAILAAAFFATSIVLTVLARLDAPPSSILDDAPTGPAAPGAPSDAGTILDQIRGQPSENNVPAPPLSTLPVPNSGENSGATDTPSAPVGTLPAPPIDTAPSPTDTTSPVGPQVPSPQ